MIAEGMQEKEAEWATQNHTQSGDTDCTRQLRGARRASWAEEESCGPSMRIL